MRNVNNQFHLLKFKYNKSLIKFFQEKYTAQAHATPIPSLTS